MTDWRDMANNRGSVTRKPPCLQTCLGNLLREKSPVVYPVPVSCRAIPSTHPTFLRSRLP